MDNENVNPLTGLIAGMHKRPYQLFGSLGAANENKNADDMTKCKVARRPLKDVTDVFAQVWVTLLRSLFCSLLW